AFGQGRSPDRLEGEIRAGPRGAQGADRARGRTQAYPIGRHSTECASAAETAARSRVILVDTSIWIDHLRKADPVLAGLLHTGQALSHPFVIGEVALGSLNPRAPVLTAIQDLPQSLAARDEDVLFFIDAHRLFGLGIGYVDAHLLASVQLT